MKVRFFAEFFGSLFLLMIIVGSGIMGETLANGNEAIALLANSLATGLGLFVLIQSLASISGAHFNPLVTLTEMLSGRLKKQEMFLYWIAQFCGSITGVLLTHLMFNKDLFQISQKSRATPNLYFSEIIATFGLITLIGIIGKKRIESAPLTIASYITSAYWFTSSTSFANPAVTIARTFTNSFCGIAPDGVPFFILSQLIGALLSFYLVSSRI